MALPPKTVRGFGAVALAAVEATASAQADRWKDVTPWRATRHRGMRHRVYAYGPNLARDGRGASGEVLIVEDDATSVCYVRVEAYNTFSATIHRLIEVLRKAALREGCAAPKIETHATPGGMCHTSFYVEYARK